VRLIWQDLRHAIRRLTRQPGFTIAAVVMLSLGIGACTVILSVVNSVLLDPLKIPEPQRLLQIQERHPGESSGNFTYANYVDLSRCSKTLHEVAAYRPWLFNLSGGNEPETVNGFLVTPDFFRSVGAAPVLGRTFAEEENTPGSSDVVVLSYSLWRRRFGSDGQVVGKICKLNGLATRIIGVMPDGFEFPAGAGLWTPLAPDAELFRNRRSHLLTVIGRMNEGIKLEEARAELRTLASRIDQANRGVDPDWTAYAVPFRESLTAGIRLPLMTFLGAVGLLLLLVCANVANLQLVRVVSRKRELGIRVALGVSRAQVAASIFMENILLALSAGLLSLWLGNYGLRVLLALSPQNIPRLETVHIDAKVAGTVLVLAVFVGILFGLLPTFHALRTNAQEALQASPRSSMRRRESRIFQALIVAEVSLSLVLLIGAGLLTNSFVRLMRVPLGFEPQGVLTIQLFSPDVVESHPDARVIQKWKETLERVRAVPGVQSAGLVNCLPVAGGVGTDFEIEGRPAFPPGDEPSAEIRVIDPHYLQTMQIPLLQGRDFSDRDSATSTKVVLINRAMARRFWPGQDPVGKHVTMKDWGPPLTGEIVGVVGDVSQDGPAVAINSMIYWPYPQFPSLFNYLVIRSQGDSRSVLENVRRQIWSVDPDWPLAEIRTMTEVLEGSVAQRKFSMFLAGLFAAISLLLAAAGIATVMAFTTTQRTQELGIRRALGAQPSDILQLVLGFGARLILLGLAAGLAVACAGAHLLAELLFGVSTLDPLTYLLAAVILSAAALLACYLPARRATRVDPLVALRYE
jgi:putative ABC transport system permease protein